MSNLNAIGILSDTELEECLVEGNVDLDWRLSIKKNWTLRADKTLVLLVEIIDKIFEIGSFYKLDPQIAIILGLLDGEKTIKEVIIEAAELFDVSEEKISNALTSFLKTASPVFTLLNNDNGRKYDLSKFIIPKDKINVNPPRLGGPVSLILHIADACSRNCIYCNVQKRPTSKINALTTEQLFSVIDQAAEIGVLTVSIAGGEPLLRNDIPQLIDRIFKNGMKCSFSTKAYVSPEMAERLRNVDVEYAQVSIDAPDENVADIMAGSVGFYKDAVASIKNLRNAGMKVRTNSMITPFNLHMVGDLVELLASLGVYEAGMSVPSRSLHNGAVSDTLFLNHRQGKWLENEIKQLQVKYESSGIQLKPYEFAVDYSWVRKSDRKRRFSERSFCSAGRTAILVLEDGNVVLCEECPVVDELIFGNVKEQSLQEIWNSPKIDEFLHPPREKYRGTECYDCQEYDECHLAKGRCWRESLKAYGKIYAPAPMCPYAPAGKRIM